MGLEGPLAVESPVSGLLGESLDPTESTPVIEYLRSELGFKNRGSEGTKLGSLVEVPNTLLRKMGPIIVPAL